MADKYMNGDKVTVTATVATDMKDGTVCCLFNAPKLNPNRIVFFVSEEDIATHTPKPRPIQVGDTVGFNDIKFHVMGLHEEYAWLKRIRDNNTIIDQEFYTLKLNVIERV